MAHRADLIPGADQLIKQIKQRGYKLALVADGSVGTFSNCLGNYGLYELFDCHAISENLGVEKPHPAMFPGQTHHNQKRQNNRE